jgi:phosphatidylglycerol:prolipoprotein diacylglycerol transferase
MHPTIISVGSFAVHSYGLLLAAAFLVSIQVFLARGRARGLPEDRLSTLSLWLLVLAIVGGRSLFVLTHWNDYASDPLGIVRLWEGGLMLYGGYILAIAGGIAYVRRAGLPVWRVADAAAPGMAVGIGIGRLGCFLNGCCYGLPTHASWGIKFPPESYSSMVFPDQALHPSQLYMAGAGFALFFALLWLDRKPRFDGRLFWTYVAMDATLRFVIDFTRYYDATSFIGKVGGLSFNVNQVLSGILFLTAMVMLRALARGPVFGALAATPAREPRIAGSAAESAEASTASPAAGQPPNA